LVSTVCCYFVYAGYTKKIIIDVRNASVFMSHIRFSLFIAFTIIALAYYFMKENKLILKLLYIITSCWLLYFMYKLEMATGFLCLLITTGILVSSLGLKRLNKTIALGLGIVLVVSFGLVINRGVSGLKMFEPLPASASNQILEKNINGRGFYHDTRSKVAENGNLIFININSFELEKEWNERSAIKFNELDRKGNEVKFTALRFLASKGLTKDSLGIASLSQTEITAIENGNTNYKYNINSGLISKWRGLVWEYAKYKRGENPSGHTLTMRLEFWKNATYIIYMNPVFGVGTGDIQDAFNAMYDQTKSKLDPVWRLRCHNQYLAITVAFGMLGLLLFLFYLFYPAIILRKKLHYLYWPFLIIALLSFVTEDTLETQAGVTFFIFFQVLFLWLASFQTNTDLRNQD
ncbi:MAG: Lipid core - O-antigen ligase, partial [Bacteroidota bacterium]|nr:Lipid core - O-antigen ligase [Bacteroidota bacterium]